MSGLTIPRRGVIEPDRVTAVLVLEWSVPAADIGLGPDHSLRPSDSMVRAEVPALRLWWSPAGRVGRMGLWRVQI